MTGTPIDGHVHFHTNFSLALALDSAANNFRPINAKTAVLLVAHIGSGDPLARLRKECPFGWKTEPADSNSLVLYGSDNMQLVAVAGRQVMTLEKLELLTIGSQVELPHGRALSAAISQASDAGAVPVVPWGFGKWWFKRGKVLAELIASKRDGTWLIGDNGCRPSIWQPRLLREATSNSIGYLAGSDPLPLQSHQTRIGAFGSLVPMDVDLNRPTEWVRTTLLGHAKSFSTFGRCRTMTEFGKDQLGLRLTKGNRTFHE